MVFISHSKGVIWISIDSIATTWNFLDSTCLYLLNQQLTYSLGGTQWCMF